MVLWKMSDSCKCDSSVSIAIFESDKALYQVQSNSAFWRDWISNFKMNYYSVQREDFLPIFESEKVDSLVERSLAEGMGV